MTETIEITYYRLGTKVRFRDSSILDLTQKNQTNIFETFRLVLKGERKRVVDRGIYFLFKVIMCGSSRSYLSRLDILLRKTVVRVLIVVVFN